MKTECPKKPCMWYIVSSSNYSPPYSPLENVTEEEAKDNEGMSPETEHEEQYQEIGL